MPLDDYSEKELKKRAKPEINERWWKQAWPGEKPPSSHAAMTKAIKSYKEARRGTVQSDLLTALDDLDAIAKKLKSDAKSLNGTPKRQKAFLNDLSAFAALVDAERKAAQKYGNKTREVFRYDFAARVLEILKKDKAGARVKLSGSVVKIELLEAIVQEIDARNALNSLYGQFSEALDQQAEKAAKQIAELARERVLSNDDQTCRMAQKIMDKHAAMLAELHHKAPTNVVKKLGLNAAMEAQYQKELKKRRIEIAKSTVLTTASGVAIALPGTQAFAIYGFARSAAGLTQQIVEHNLNIAQAASVLQKQLAVLTKTFKNGAGRMGSETGGTTLNAVLGVDIVPTLDKATSNLKTLESNTRHAGFKVQKLTDEIMKMMDSCKDLDRTCQSLPKGHPYARILNKNLARQEKRLDQLLGKTTQLGKQLTAVERRLPTLQKSLKGLGTNTKGQKIANFTAKTLVNLGAIAGGGMVDATAASTAADAAVKGGKEIAAMTVASTGYANELFSTAKEIRDEAKS